MGSSSSSSLSIEDYGAKIKTSNGPKFIISHHSLVEHILLLRKVINNPEMTTEGRVLNYYINDYCKRMAQDEMRTKEQQLKLPWQIEWIWHVHRLHPLAYLNDCTKQLSNGLVDKQVRKFIKRCDEQDKSKKLKIIFSSTKTNSLFIPSIDLAKAVIRQKDFLDKFQKHFIYSNNLRKLSRYNFQIAVQNYASFIKLAQQNQLVVPTFEIDLIWHTHMRFPSHYHQLSIALCGFIIDHDDSIESNILTDSYQKTADRWKQAYNSEYGRNIDQKHLETSQFMSSCAIVVVPIPAPVHVPTPVRVPAPVRAPSPVRIPATVHVPTPVRVPAPVRAPSPVRAPAPVHVPTPVRVPAPAVKKTATHSTIQTGGESNSASARNTYHAGNNYYLSYDTGYSGGFSNGGGGCGDTGGGGGDCDTGGGGGGCEGGGGGSCGGGGGGCGGGGGGCGGGGGGCGGGGGD